MDGSNAHKKAAPDIKACATNADIDHSCCETHSFIPFNSSCLQTTLNLIPSLRLMTRSRRHPSRNRPLPIHQNYRQNPMSP